MHFAAWDIETDTSGDGGLDPGTDAIVSIAAVLAPWRPGPQADLIDEFYGAASEGPGGERDLLHRFGEWLASTGAGFIVGWNSVVFDAPYVHRRAEIVGAELDLWLRADPTTPPRYHALAGFGGAYAHRWAGAESVDIMYAVYDKAWCTAAGSGTRLKDVGRHHGFDPIELDRSRLHLYSPEEQRSYNVSDAETTAHLAVIALASGLLDEHGRRPLLHRAA